MKPNTIQSITLLKSVQTRTSFVLLLFPFFRSESDSALVSDRWELVGEDDFSDLERAEWLFLSHVSQGRPETHFCPVRERPQRLLRDCVFSKNLSAWWQIEGRLHNVCVAVKSIGFKLQFLKWLEDYSSTDAFFYCITRINVLTF